MSKTGLALFALAVVAGCLPPTLSVPRGGRIACDGSLSCPDDFGCLESQGRCAPLASGCIEPDGRFVVPVDDGTPCVDGGVAGACRSGVCGAACGNGVVDATAGELCDFGAENKDDIADRCRTDCLPARCGDGVVDSGESCDDDGADCDACFRICVAGTLDENGLLEDGCEADIGVAFSAPAGAAQFLIGTGGVLTYIDTDTRAIRARDVVRGTERLVVQPTDFVTRIAVIGATTAWTQGSLATLFLAGADGVARRQEDQVTEIAGGGGQLYVMLVDRLERRRVDNGAVTALPGEVTFPPFLLAGDEAAVWATAEGLRQLRHDAPASASRLIAPGVLGASAGVLEGETFWYLDDSLNLWRVEPGSSPRQVTSMPAALAGHFPHAGMVSPGPGRVLTALTLDPEPLEDGDEVAALLETDVAGTWVMRGRDEDSFLSMAVADGRVWVSTSLGVFEVSP